MPRTNNTTRLLTHVDLLPNNLIEWFDDDDTYHEQYQLVNHVDGYMDHYYLKLRFADLDYNIERRVRTRMLPGYEKKVHGRPAVIVGALTMKQFKIYIEELSSTARPSKEKIERFKVPSFNTGYRNEEAHERIEWHNGKLPHLSHKNTWAFSKWVDCNSKELHRAYVTLFALVRNSYSNAIRVEFTYVTEFYCYNEKKWKLI